MSASDSAMLQGLTERIDRLEGQVSGTGSAAGSALMPSRTKKQAKTMAAAAHNPAFAKKVGIPQSVAKDFNQADKGTGILKKKKGKKGR